MTVYAFVPARGGSTRVPRKNLAEVGGESLLIRAMHTAWHALVDTVVVSSDDPEIVQHAVDWHHFAFENGFGDNAGGAPLISIHHRQPQHATSTAQLEDAIADWLHRGEFDDDDVVAVAQVTSPFTRPESIRECIRMVREEGCDSALTVYMDVKRAAFSGRVRAIYDDQKRRDVGLKVIWDRPYNYRPRTQDVRPVPLESGNCWAFSVRHFRATRCRMGGREAVVPVDWFESIDVDTLQDLEVARVLAPHVDRIRGAGFRPGARVCRKNARDLAGTIRTLHPSINARTKPSRVHWYVDWDGCDGYEGPATVLESDLELL